MTEALLPARRLTTTRLDRSSSRLAPPMGFLLSCITVSSWLVKPAKGLPFRHGSIEPAKRIPRCRFYGCSLGLFGYDEPLVDAPNSGASGEFWCTLGQAHTWKGMALFQSSLLPILILLHSRRRLAHPL